MSFLVLEADGTSHFLLEDATGDILLEGGAADSSGGNLGLLGVG